MATITASRKMKVKKTRRLDDPEEVKKASVGYKPPMKAKVKVAKKKAEPAKEKEVPLEEQAKMIGADLPDDPETKKATITQPGQALEPTLGNLQLAEQAASIGEDISEQGANIETKKIEVPAYRLEGAAPKKKVKIKRKAQ